MSRQQLTLAAVAVLSLTGCLVVDENEPQPSVQRDTQMTALALFVADMATLAADYRYSHPSQQLPQQQWVLNRTSLALSQLTGQPLRLQKESQFDSCELGSLAITSSSAEGQLTSTSFSTQYQPQTMTLKFQQCQMGDWQLNGQIELTSQWRHQQNASASNPAYQSTWDHYTALDLTLVQASTGLEAYVDIKDNSSANSDNNKIRSSNLDQQGRVQLISLPSTARIGLKTADAQTLWLPLTQKHPLYYRSGSGQPQEGALKLGSQWQTQYELRFTLGRLSWQKDTQPFVTRNWHEFSLVAVQSTL